jgi:hypothetical protein
MTSKANFSLYPKLSDLLRRLFSRSGRGTGVVISGEVYRDFLYTAKVWEYGR